MIVADNQSVNLSTNDQQNSPDIDDTVIDINQPTTQTAVGRKKNSH